MLLIQHYAKRSKIHGIGLFAKEKIPAGTVVWKYDPNFDVEIPLWFANMLPEPYFSVLKENAEFIEERGVFILGNDGDIFMNHSNDPNLVDHGTYMVAAKDINEDDEITCDYRLVKVLSYDLQSGGEDED